MKLKVESWHDSDLLRIVVVPSQSLVIGYLEPFFAGKRVWIAWTIRQPIFKTSKGLVLRKTFRGLGNAIREIENIEGEWNIESL